MAGKDRVLHLYSEDSHADNAKKGNDEENRGMVNKIGAVEKEQAHAQSAHKLNVFERNYQYARIYDNKRCALKAAMDSDALSKCHFKASLMPIAQTPVKRRQLPKFTVPDTPEVLKRKPRT